jgi:hypothetical protein
MSALLAAAVDPDAARESAREILSDRRFSHDPAPRPLRGVVEWIGDRLASIGRWLGDLIDTVPAVLWLAIGLLLVALLFARVFTNVRGRRRRTAPAGVAMPGTLGPDEDPNALERDAELAERGGDLDRAVRLRFRAGLLRLGRRGAIHYRPSVTTGEVRRTLGSQRFDELAQTFERVAYGGQDATPPDVDAARREWPHVLAGTGRR